MSKLNLSKINFNENDFVVEFEDKVQLSFIEKQEQKQKEEEEFKKQRKLELDRTIQEQELIIMHAREKANEIIEQAKLEAQELKENILNEAQEEKSKIIEQAQLEAQELIKNSSETSQKEADELIEKSKEEIENSRIEATNNGYQDGHKEGIEKAQEELEEKIEKFNTFCNQQLEIKDKIIKAANKDILDLIINISKKILLKEVNAEVIDSIIKKTISLLEKKEDINIVVSEDYAKLLLDVQNKDLENEEEIKFENFKQYNGFNLNYNPKYAPDTIIVENLKERFNASINDQLDTIIRNIYENSQNGKIDLESYTENETERTE